MKLDNRQTGYFAENLAVEALKKKDYQILETNFGSRFGEIDIIAKDKDTLVFVEVKAKKGLDYGSPEEMISRHKLKRVQNMAAVYMKGEDKSCRIDVVAIVLSGENELLRLTHYENVYL
ncbi:YraN family protein [Patescibacteria group bacterium]|nr:YraN family protein [Patescibacteria group bacterium]